MQNSKIGYSKKEAAQATSLSVRTIDYLLQSGELKGVKINRRVVIPAKSLHRLIELGMKGHSKQDVGAGKEREVQVEIAN